LDGGAVVGEAVAVVPAEGVVAAGEDGGGPVGAIATSEPNRRRDFPQFFGRSDFPGATGSS